MSDSPAPHAVPHAELGPAFALQHSSPGLAGGPAQLQHHYGGNTAGSSALPGWEEQADASAAWATANAEVTTSLSMAFYSAHHVEDPVNSGMVETDWELPWSY